MRGPANNFNQRDFRLRRIKEILAAGFRERGAECRVLCLMAEIRKVLEIDDLDDRFRILKFFCNWALHSAVDRGDIPLELLRSITNVVIRHRNILRWVPGFERMLFPKLRRDFRRFLKEHQVSPSAVPLRGGEVTHVRSAWSSGSGGNRMGRLRTLPRGRIRPALVGPTLNVDGKAVSNACGAQNRQTLSKLTNWLTRTLAV